MRRTSIAPLPQPRGQASAVEQAFSLWRQASPVGQASACPPFLKAEEVDPAEGVAGDQFAVVDEGTGKRRGVAGEGGKDCSASQIPQLQRVVGGSGNRPPPRSPGLESARDPPPWGGFFARAGLQANVLPPTGFVGAGPPPSPCAVFGI